MLFALATIIAVVPLFAAASPLSQPPHITIPISKRANFRRDDGSVDAEALKASVAASTTCVFPLLDRLIYDLTCSTVRYFVVSIPTNGTLASGTRPNQTTTSAPLVERLSSKVKGIIGMVRILKSLK
jgi:hypothetical protein